MHEKKVIVQVYMDIDEKNFIKEAAKNADRPLSGYIRREMIKVARSKLGYDVDYFITNVKKDIDTH